MKTLRRTRDTDALAAAALEWVRVVPPVTKTVSGR
jgi:hypothetical protein